jgi:hypothetical protein
MSLNRFASHLAKVAALALIPVLVACSSGEGESAGNGVDDVRAACQIRASWTRTTGDDCLTCLAQTQSPPCGCETEREFIGACLEQHQSRIEAEECTGLTACANACGSDCACVDACYAEDARCRALASAADGCQAEVCRPHCE